MRQQFNWSCFYSPNPPCVPTGFPDGVNVRLDSLCRAVIANPSVDVSFREHAASTRASARTLPRLFSSELGLSFAVWRRRVQLPIAVSCLAAGNSVTDVARSLGYRPSSFSEISRRHWAFRPVRTLHPIPSHMVRKSSNRMAWPPLLTSRVSTRASRIICGRATISATSRAIHPADATRTMFDLRFLQARRMRTRSVRT